MKQILQETETKRSISLKKIALSVWVASVTPNTRAEKEDGETKYATIPDATTVTKSFSRPISTKKSFNFINTLSNSRDFDNSIQLGFLFRYYCIQFRFRAHMISFFSFYFVYRHSKLQDHLSYVEYLPHFRNRCNQIQSHRSAQDFVAVVSFLFRLWAMHFNIWAFKFNMSMIRLIWV